MLIFSPENDMFLTSVQLEVLTKNSIFLNSENRHLILNNVISSRKIFSLQTPPTFLIFEWQQQVVNHAKVSKSNRLKNAQSK